MLYSFIESFRGLSKQERVAIDNDVFRLHYRYTVCLLFLCSGLITANQLFGNPMTCHLRGESLPERMVTNYCWVTATYTLKHINQPIVREVEDLSDGEKQFVRRFGYSQQLLAAAQPGLGVFHAGKHQKIYHVYYQWVFIFLCIQALMFYAPWQIWKRFEGGRLKFCAFGMSEPELDGEKRQARVEKLLKCYGKFKSKGCSYAYQFLGLELFNLVNTAAQMVVLNKLMAGRWIDYGVHLWNHISFGGEKLYKVDPMEEIFPKMTKCDFFTHSSVGQVDKFDAMCLLPLNTVNEKVFLVLWFWFIILTTCSALALIYRLCMIVFPLGRMCMLNRDGSKWKHVVSAVKNCKYADWFLLKQMSKNVDSETFGDFLESLNKEDDIDKNDFGRPSIWTSIWESISLRKKPGIRRLNEMDTLDLQSCTRWKAVDTQDTDSKITFDNE